MNCASPLLSIHTVLCETYNWVFWQLKDVYLFSAGWYFYLYFKVFKYRHTYIWICPFGFAAIGHRALLFACMVPENNMPVIQMLQTEFNTKEIHSCQYFDCCWNSILYYFYSNNHSCFINKITCYHLLNAQNSYYSPSSHTLPLFFCYVGGLVYSLSLRLHYLPFKSEIASYFIVHAD